MDYPINPDLHELPPAQPTNLAGLMLSLHAGIEELESVVEARSRLFDAAGVRQAQERKHTFVESFPTRILNFKKSGGVIPPYLDIETGWGKQTAEAPFDDGSTRYRWTIYFPVE